MTWAIGRGTMGRIDALQRTAVRMEVVARLRHPESTKAEVKTVLFKWRLCRFPLPPCPSRLSFLQQALGGGDRLGSPFFDMLSLAEVAA